MRAARVRAEAGEAEVRRLNRDLERMVAERTADLEVANTQLEAFAYTVSHDLRAPLRGMEGFARILLDDFADGLGPKGKRHAERIVAAAQRMEALISDLLTFSRLQRIDVSLRAIDPTGIVRTAANEAHALAGPEDAIIRIDEPLPKVAAEPTVLKQVVGNLLTNAVKFRKDGEPAQVRVWGQEFDGHVRLWVEDQGIGIAPEHQERIFGTFERLHGQEAYPGNGIGLAIVKAGAERMGGRAGVESTPEAGARFWVELAAPKPAA
ncbi:two-component hybrid sensor and regulator [Rubellimicrobium mesophilum DSM 19309]|uniref:histidine kinase n=2 Tax=Rubellimicrobium TaxID=295418 RepID=A0A017HJQ1_9RHOB|nr:two-component hybrid sensor and regulator [Rubellimicrobium mesophilum DSM 19309]